MAPTRRRFLELLGGALAMGLGGPPTPASAQERTLAVHRATRNTRLGAIGAGLRRELGALGGPTERAHAWPGAPREPLPAPEREPALPFGEALGRAGAAAGFRADPISMRRLARLLHFTNGVTGRSPAGVALRAAPSAGALYAGEFYLVAEHVEGLAPGVYGFAPLEGRLVRLRPGSALDEVARGLESPARARGAAVAVLLTNVFARYERRYAQRGYRYALIDSGHQGENLRLTAASSGLSSWGPLRFHDARLNALLGLDGVEEAVCALHLVGTPAEGPGAAEGRAFVEAHRAGQPPPDGADDPTERYHAATRLVAAGDALSQGQGAATEPGPPSGEPRAPSTPPTPDCTVEEAIARRRSARRFGTRPLAGPELAFVLRAACGHAALRRVGGLSLRVFVHRVEGVETGLYQVSEGRLRSLRRGDLTDALVGACLGQVKAGRAAAALAMVGDLRRTAERRGDRAYRDLLLEAGGVGQRIYLAAEALGLAARNLAAFLDEELDALAQVDGRRRAVVHLTLLGPGGPTGGSAGASASAARSA